MSTKSVTRRWSFWVVVCVVVMGGISSVGGTSDDEPDDTVARPSTSTTPSPAPSTVEPAVATEPTVAVLRVTDQKDGDSFVASDGEEYRLGLVNTPERDEPCGAEATAFTRDFLADGFTADAYTTDSYGRNVAEVRNTDGRSLNVALARSGLGGDRYLEQFRHENRGMARRLDAALASAEKPSCRTAAAPVPLVSEPKDTPKPRKAKKSTSCADGYSPCLPIVADLDCPEIGHPVTVTGRDPYGLDRDRDGIGCD